LTASTLRVALFVGTRADLSPLEPVISALAAEPSVELHLLCGLAFSAEELASLTADLGVAITIHELVPPIRSVGTAEVLEQGAGISHGMRMLLAAEHLDSLVVLGDRWELLYVVPPAYLSGVRIVHLHGGEITEGALDERVRHAITKLADLHCVASTDAARRVLQMGEPADRVVVTGAPGLDRLRGVERLGTEALSALIGVDLSHPIALFTYHPPTAVADAPVGDWARDALAATAEVCGSVIATYPGMDVGRDEVLAGLASVANERSNVALIESLGRRYPRTLASVDVVVGNSSSGIIEAASVGVPVVNVGDRQSGRLRGSNVISVAEGYATVTQGLIEALSKEFRSHARATVNPYGDGNAADLIVKAVLSSQALGRAKPFVDHAEEQGE